MEKVFVPGLVVKRNDNAPEYVLANVSARKRELIEWLQSSPGDWVNFVLKRGKSGKCYAEVDNWKPTERARDLVEQKPAAAPDLDDDIPF